MLRSMGLKMEKDCYKMLMEHISSVKISLMKVVWELLLRNKQRKDKEQSDQL